MAAERGAARAAPRHARTYVWTPPDDSRVVAYYSVAPTQVHRKAVSSSLAGGVSVIPAYLLARLALDAALQGAGLGARLLVDALDTIVTAAEAASGRLIVVDAIDEAARAFYQHHDVRPIRGTARLVMKVSMPEPYWPAPVRRAEPGQQAFLRATAGGGSYLRDQDPGDDVGDHQ